MDVPKSFQDTAEGNAVTRVASDFGLRSGRAIPVWRRRGFAGAVGFASKVRVSDPDIQRAIDIIAIVAHDRVIELAGETSSQCWLSAGERDVLSWVAVGKTTWEISEILKISERAVEWRLRQALVKLDAVTRTQAVVLAIKNGQIEI